MKYFFVSDIHGNFEQFQNCIEAFDKEGADKIILLGDTASSVDNIINTQIANILNTNKEKIEVIRGNCDTADFEKLLNFEIFDIDNLYINKRYVTITHGHYYNCYDLPENCGDIFIQGHTHVPMLIKQGNKIIANPGSVSRPKGSDLRCYILIDEEKIYLKTLDSKIVKSIDLRGEPK